MVTLIFFLSSGLFLGWSLGANNAANFFGSAVATRMVSFRLAAIICSIFVILGAVFGGAGAAGTLSKLGSIATLPGAFVVALSAAISSLIMTKAGIPISTSQAIVGGIIGWNFFAHVSTDLDALYKIAGTWIFSPILTAITSIILFHLFRFVIEISKIHLLRLDHYTRIALIVVGAFGSYSLGANNIGNVVGVFISTSPFKDFSFLGLFNFTAPQQLFFIGGISIAVGIFTYSKRVMMTVGEGIFKLSPVTALVVVLSTSITLFLFASVELRDFLTSHHLPSFPLVPVSSSQAIVGAVMGISLAKGARNLNVKKIGEISLGWIVTPIVSAIISFFTLFFMQNVFLQQIM